MNRRIGKMSSADYLLPPASKTWPYTIPPDVIGQTTEAGYTTRLAGAFEFGAVLDEVETAILDICSDPKGDDHADG